MISTLARCPIRVGIVDDHKILRASLVQYLGLHPDMRFVAEANDGKTAVELVQNYRINVLLLDLRMPRFNGVEAIAQLRLRSPDTQILVFSGLPEELHAVSVIRRGASGYLSKDCALPEIAHAIRTVALGHLYLSPAATQLMAQEVLTGAKSALHETLATREFQTFIRLARGASVSAVSRELSLSAKTISTYRKRVLDKLEVASNSEMTHYAVKHGLID